MSRARSLARRYAVQAIYQWQVGGVENAVDLYFVTDKDRNRIDEDYFHELVEQVVENSDAFDAELSDNIDRKVSDIDPVERAILRLGVYEFKHCLDVPYRVIINEYIELAKLFGAHNSYKYINGILDKLALKLRPAETKSKSG